ncbi:CpmK protein [Serratia marcescens]|nr:CpmK protein [Serratia marcescens]
MELIQRALDRQPALCLGEIQWPVSITRGESVWINAKMEALVDAGLVKSQQTSARKAWSLTHAGQAEFNKHGDFCYGRIRIKKIENIVSHGYRYKSVIFYYYIENLPRWAKNKSIRVAYSDLDNLVMGIYKDRYQVDIETSSTGSMKIIGEPYQLDLLY